MVAITLKISPRTQIAGNTCFDPFWVKMERIYFWTFPEYTPKPQQDDKVYKQNKLYTVFALPGCSGLCLSQISTIYTYNRATSKVSVRLVSFGGHFKLLCQVYCVQYQWLVASFFRCGSISCKHCVIHKLTHKLTN